MELKGQSKGSSDCVNRQPRKGPIVWHGDFMPWSSIWRGEQLLKLPVSSKCTDPKFLSGCTIGNSTVWKEFWRDSAAVVLPNCRINNCKRWQTSWIVALWPTDFIRVFGLVPWSPESLKRNSRSLTIRPMFRASFTNLNSPFSAPERFWPVRINTPNLGGSGIVTRTLKKSQKPRGCPPLRGRSFFPAGPHPLPNMGQSRMPTRNSHHRAEEVFKSLWYDRALCGPLPLPFSTSLQCFDLYRLPGEAGSKLLSPQNLSHPGQRLLSQGRGGLGLVFWTSQKHRGLQSPDLLARTQCVRKNLALYAGGCHAQSLLRDSRGTIFILNFNFPEYPESSVSGPRSLASFSIIYNVALFMQRYISTLQLGLRINIHTRNIKFEK